MEKIISAVDNVYYNLFHAPANAKQIIQNKSWFLTGQKNKELR